MSYCAILECKNNSRNQNKNTSKGNVSYHRFPKDDELKEQWINATGRIKWKPSASSTICSDHFLATDMLITNKDYRYLNSNAVPSVKVMNFLPKQSNFNASDDSYTKHITRNFDKLDRGTSCRNEIARILIDMIDTHSVTSDSTSTESKITTNNERTRRESLESIPKEEGRLRWYQERLKEKDLKIRRLQAFNRKLLKKLTATEEVLNALEAKKERKK